MRRVLCIWLPNWPIQRVERVQRGARSAEREAHSSECRVFCAHSALRASRSALHVLYAPAGRSKFQVTACSSSARQEGVMPGMPLAEARALAPAACFAPHEPHADREALQKLALWCQRYSPFVAVAEAEHPDSLLL